MRHVLKGVRIGAAVVLLGAAAASAQDRADLGVSGSDHAIGDAGAKVVLVEYASFTCSHCADFHRDVLPEIKKEFVESGKVRYVYRDFPLDGLALAAATVARCAGRDRFFGFVETFYRTQQRWARASDPAAALGRLARLGGMAAPDFDKCLARQDLRKEILEQRLDASRRLGVDSTPTVFVNGVRLAAPSLERLRAAIERELAR